MEWRCRNDDKSHGVGDTVYGYTNRKGGHFDDFDPDFRVRICVSTSMISTLAPTTMSITWTQMENNVNRNMPVIVTSSLSNDAGRKTSSSLWTRCCLTPTAANVSRTVLEDDPWGWKDGGSMMFCRTH